ncbi:hypothetical protein BP5796_10641 [Coleophoma crateriformis]|uniref:DUF7908 domain-containing protein n=1 Tax=Coleophoma crateriformis TaxID=565419 RepID=A0A3D8QQQ9_9HELO|nr:hypothetical protein BP5796_10641 [Coleophoma crateriformis]
MFSKLVTSAVTLASLLRFSQATALQRRLDYCVDPTVVFIKTYEISYPVFINTYISANTIININGGVTININNAPTYISTVVTGITNSTVYATTTATATITTTATVSPTAAATGIPLPGPDAIPINLALVPSALKKRQSGSSNSTYVGPGGQVVQGCAQAVTFYLQDGNLLAGNGEIVSTGYNLSYAPFAASTVAGPITQSFSLSADLLQWTNALFPNKIATFCLLGGILEAVFVTEEPVGCSHQLLQAISPSVCGASASSSLSVSTQVSTMQNGSFTSATLGPTVTAIVSTLPDGSLTTLDSTLFPTGTAGVSSTPGGPNVITSTVTNPDGSVSTILITQTTQPTGASTTGFSSETSVLVETSTIPGTVTTSSGPIETSTLGNGSLTTNSGPLTTLTVPPSTETTSIPITEPLSSTNQTSTSQSSSSQTSDTLLPTGTISPASSFVIAADTGSGAKHKRAGTKWFTFINDSAALSDTLDGAALFSTALGRLYSGGKNVGLSRADIEAGFAPFRAFFGEPDISEKFDVSPGGGFSFTPSANGTALGFVATFCFTPDGEIISRYSEKGLTFTCTTLTVTIQIVSNNDPQMPSSSSSAAPTSSIPPVTTTGVTTLPDGQVTSTTGTVPGTTPSTPGPTGTGVITSSGSSLPVTSTPTSGSLPPSSSPTTSATSTADISADMSGDLNIPGPTSAPAVARGISLKKRANIPGNKLYRGGLLRSPWAPRLV